MKYFVLAIITAFLVSTAVKAQRLYFYTVEESSAPHADSYYYLMAKKIAYDNGMKLYKAPFNRSLRSFLEDTSGCIFPVDPYLIKNESKQAMVYSAHILEAPLRMFMLKDNIERKNGFPKVLAVNRSVIRYLHKEFKLKYKIFLVNSDVQLIDMLVKNRVDAVVALDPDFLNLFKESSYYKIEKIQAKVYGENIFKIRDVMACKKNPQNIAIINQLNKFLKRLD